MKGCNKAIFAGNSLSTPKAHHIFVGSFTSNKKVDPGKVYNR